MERIVLASNNKYKAKEFQKMFDKSEILTLKDVGFFDDIAETGTTFLENSVIKAKALTEFLNKKGMPSTVIADDSGLCVNFLGGAPGIYSARYSGDHDDAENRKKLLKDLCGIKNRRAHYSCVIVKMKPDFSYVYAEGKCYGHITTKERGISDFGFDKVFYSDDLKKTFAEVTADEKNKVSHRARALSKIRLIWDK